jgi:hypothetical protein
MIFKQYENGSCDIEFSDEEIDTLIKKRKLHFSDEYLKHFGNNMVRIVSEWNMKFNEKLKNKETNEYSKMEGK